MPDLSIKQLHSILLSLAPLISVDTAAQGLFCDPAGQVVIFSNYDGGRLTINVDEDIPNLRIGVVSYEYARIIITGPYAANVTGVTYVGYNGDNDHCSAGTPMTTTVLGVPSSITNILQYPPATLADANGNGSMICGYSCTQGSYQGGCNTADQIAHYFQTLWGASFYFHRTQYGCWTDEWAISEGGNCCAGLLTTGLTGRTLTERPFTVRTEGSLLQMTGSGPVDILTVSGTVLCTVDVDVDGSAMVDLASVTPGVLMARERCTGNVQRFVWAY